MTQLELFKGLSIVTAGGRRRARRARVPYWQREDWVERTIAAAERARRAREDAHRAALEALGPQTVALISCGARKGAGPAPARELYTSTLFRKSRAFAEAYGDSWYVISALHGLLSPDQTVSPYNFKMSQLSQRQREAWANRVTDSIKYHVPYGSTIIIVAGRLYRENLEWRLIRQGFDVLTPTRGQNIFQLMSYLTEQVRASPRVKLGRVA